MLHVSDEALAKLQRKSKPLGDHLVQHSSMKVELTPAPDYAAVAESLAANKLYVPRALPESGLCI